jgi:uracil phosphoribosyltransferase
LDGWARLGYLVGVALTVLEHPLVADRVALLRARNTDRATFRRVLGELAAMLLYEACRDLPVVEKPVQTPLALTPAPVLGVRPCLVPVTRAGLGMLGAALSLLPEADVGFVGMKRDETTLEQLPYLNTLPPDLEGRPVFILEPMVATGGSAALACEYVADARARDIVVLTAIASREGVAVLERHPARPRIFAAAVDPDLNDAGFIVPGLGDAGDRQFGDYHDETSRRSSG